MIDITSNPSIWMERVLKFRTYEKMEEALNKVHEKNMVLITGANGIGKSYALAAYAIYYLLTRKNAIVAITSASCGQMQRGIWRYVQNFARKVWFANLDITASKIKLTDNAYIIPVATNTPERLQGLHTKNLMVIVDEGSSIPPWAEEVLFSLGADKIVISANPLTTQGVLYKLWRSNMFCNISLSALDHPNVIENKEIYPGAVTKNGIEVIREMFGEDHPAYIARVLGQFPEKNTGLVVITPSLVYDTVTDISPNASDLSMAVDIALGGVDKTVITIADKNVIIDIIYSTIDDGEKLAQYLIDLVNDMGIKRVIIDSTGLGAPIADIVANNVSCTVTKINFASAAKDRKQFQNVRAEMYYTLSELLKHGELQILRKALDKVDVDDLMTIYYSITNQGKLLIESKQNMAKSPDLLDSMAMLAYLVKDGTDVDVIRRVLGWNK